MSVSTQKLEARTAQPQDRTGPIPGPLTTSASVIPPQRDGRQLSPYRPDDLTVAPKAVVSCYGFFDYVLSECDILDLTEGICCGDPATPYQQAQQDQINYLLDEVGCGPGSRLLDIGCGYGTLVQAALERGAEAVGITVSPEQVEHCRARGLDVRRMNYRHLPDEWSGYFDCIVANGSLEHFVQPNDLALGLADSLYQELFAVCHRLIDPESTSRRFATTAIHLRESSPRLTAVELRQSPFSFGWKSPKFHYALLQRAFGGSYPLPGQLACCGSPCFELIKEVDGTQDYDCTSAEWFRRIDRAMRSWGRGPRMAARGAKYLLAHPWHGWAMIVCLFLAKSWSWQFRGEHPPMQLLRHTWQWQDSPKCASPVERPRKPR